MRIHWLCRRAGRYVRAVSDLAFVFLSRRTAERDLCDASGKADDRADLPSAVIRAEQVEHQAAAIGAERRAGLVHDKGNAKQGRHVADAEYLRHEASDERREAGPPQ